MVRSGLGHANRDGADNRDWEPNECANEVEQQVRQGHYEAHFDVITCHPGIFPHVPEAAKHTKFPVSPNLASLSGSRPFWPSFPIDY